MAVWLLRAALAISIAWVVIPSQNRKDIDWLTPTFAAVVFVQWAILELVSAELPDGSVPFCLAVIFFATGLVLIHAGHMRLMAFAIVIGAALAGLAPLAWWCRANTSSVTPAAAVMLPGLLLMGQQETSVEELRWYVFALPLLAPLLLVEILPLKEWQTARLRCVRWALMLILVLIPLAGAIYLADQAAGPLEIP